MTLHVSGLSSESLIVNSMKNEKKNEACISRKSIEKFSSKTVYQVLLMVEYAFFSGCIQIFFVEAIFIFCFCMKIHLK